jgi:hypothetical protein
MQIIIGIIIGIFISTIGLGGMARIVDKGVDSVKSVAKDAQK